MRSLQITSTANQHLKDLVKLKVRPTADSFFIEGPHLLEPALASAATVREVFYTEAFAATTDGQDLIRLLGERHATLYEVSDPVMNKLSDTETPQGIVALVAMPHVDLVHLSPGESPLLVVIDGVQDPGNLGTIIRIADATAADIVVVLPGSCEPYLPKTIRATAGSIFNVPVIRERTDSCLAWLKTKGISLVITAADGDEPLFGAPLTGPLALAFGNEARGVSSQLKEAAAFSLSIPIYGRAESLNVATAAAVCLYEAARQRRTIETDKSFT